MRSTTAKLFVAFCLLDIFFFVQILAPSLELKCRFTDELESDQSAFVKLITNGQMDVTRAMPDRPTPPVFFVVQRFAAAPTYVSRDVHFAPGRDPPFHVS